MIALLMAFVLIGVVIRIIAGAAILLGVAGAIIVAALGLPIIQDKVKKELPRLEQIQCHEVAQAIRKAEDGRILRPIATRTLEAKAPFLHFLDLDVQGRMNDMFAKVSPFDNQQLEQLPEIAKSRGKYPVLILNANYLEASQVSSPGPILVYTDGRRQRVHEIKSATAVIFCDETISANGWIIDAPLVVAVDKEKFQTQARLQNSQTADGEVKLVEFGKIRTAAKEAIVRMINGEAPFPGMKDSDDLSLPQAQSKIDESWGKQLDITVIPPSTRPQAPAAVAAPEAPLAAAEAEDDESDKEYSVEATTEPSQASADHTWPEGTSLATLGWQRASCGGGLLYVYCNLDLVQKDLQYAVDSAFKKKGGVISKDKKFGPVDVRFNITNPRLNIASNGKIRVTVDVEVLNMSVIPEKQSPNVGEVVDRNSNSRTLSDKIVDLGRVAGAARNIARNVKRSASLAVPKRVMIRNAVASAGKVVYKKETGEFFLEDVAVEDFQLEFKNQTASQLAGFKPFVLSSATELMQPFFRTHRIYDLSEKRHWGIPLGWYALKHLSIDGSGVHIQVKFGPMIW